MQSFRDILSSRFNCLLPILPDRRQYRDGINKKYPAINISLTGCIIQGSNVRRLIEDYTFYRSVRHCAVISLAMPDSPLGSAPRNLFLWQRLNITIVVPLWDGPAAIWRLVVDLLLSGDLLLR